MSTARFIIGDTRDVTASLPDGSVDLVLTSPPFLALRSYLPADHADKHREIGAEPSPGAFLQTLLDLTAEWRRVLAPHGSIAVELGDTYSGSGGAGGDYGPTGLRDGQPAFDGSARRTRSNRPKQYGTDNGPPRRTITDEWPLPKSLCGIPHLYWLSLAYGVNLLTGEPSPAGRWRVRNVVVWCRPNPPVGELGDKFRPATSYMTIATIAGDRYFDLDAVRHENPRAAETRPRATQNRGNPRNHTDADESPVVQNEAGAPPLDWWEIPTSPYKGSHYAAWPKALCVLPILAMVPQRVCTTCGAPSRRVVENTPEYAESLASKPQGYHPGAGGGSSTAGTPRLSRDTRTVGWSDCGHGAWRTGVVFDPFAGSGTTLAVATGHGRDAIGIDLDERNADLAAERVGMFLTVEHFGDEAVA